MLAAGALATGGWVGVSSSAAPLPAAADCTNPTTITVLSFNDFHGRIKETALKLAGTIEKHREMAGEANTLLLSVGDSVGGTTFASMIAKDQPTLDVLNALDVDATAAGNHEFDRGWSDFADRVIPASDFGVLGANVYVKGTTTVAKPLKAYEVFDVSGLRVAYVGAVTGDLPSLVSPAGIAELTIGDPVEAVNRTIKELKDGNPQNGEADVIVVGYHEGGPESQPTTYEDQLSNAMFAKMAEGTDARALAILNGHTHQKYAYSTGDGRVILQAKSYGEAIGKIKLSVDPTTGEKCSVAGQVIAVPKGDKDDPFPIADYMKYPRFVEVKKIVDAAVAHADKVGAEVIGQTTDPILHQVPGKADGRSIESMMSNKVADFFYDTMSNGDRNFIGLQNPGGTRTDLDKGEVTLMEANNVLPFANTLMTTKITGAQFKKVLEQQWQIDKEGKVPTRPFLALSVSKNVTYTYDASRPQGDRITSITVAGAPIDAAKEYTVGSGSFLISGRDNFTELAKGTMTTDTGLVDLESWIAWMRKNSPISPDYAVRGVSVHETPTVLEPGKPVTFAVGVPQDAVSLGTLDIPNIPVKNTNLVATVQQPNARSAAAVEVGSAAVVDGKVQALTVTLPAGFKNGAAMLVLTASGSGTTVRIPVTLKVGDEPAPPTVKPTPPKPGLPDTGVETDDPAGAVIALGLIATVGVAIVRRTR